MPAEGDGIMKPSFYVFGSVLPAAIVIGALSGYIG